MTESLHLFLVDDDADDREIFSEILSASFPEAKFTFATDGLYALEKINGDSSFQPQYIFLDINMPRMNGIQCLSKLKNIKRIAQVPVYMYSTSASPEIVKQCILLGATDFIQKLTDIDKLQETLTDIILQHQNEA